MYEKRIEKEKIIQGIMMVKKKYKPRATKVESIDCSCERVRDFERRKGAFGNKCHCIIYKKIKGKKSYRRINAETVSI